MSGDFGHDEIMQELLNLEHIVIACLPEERRGEPFSEALLADVLRAKSGSSLVLNLALFFALTSPDASYKLVIKENTKLHPGGVPKLLAFKEKMERAEAIRYFVDESGEPKKEAAIVLAEEKFGLSRASIFQHLKMGRFFHNQS